MAPAPLLVLAINGGSSSIKFAMHQAGAPLKPSLYGKLDRIGLSGSTLSWHATETPSDEGRMDVPTLTAFTSSPTSSTGCPLSVRAPLTSSTRSATR